MIARTIWELPCMSQEFDQGPVLRQGHGDLYIAYDFEKESGEYAWEEIAFLGVGAFKFTADAHCSPDQVGAYDKLQLLEGSPWKESLGGEATVTLDHYRIYFDEVGCFEILASAFVPPPLSAGESTSS